ncbi:hypothetical protein KIW84_012289 [Lathyrus oleraceus]|uniref:Uncharacterized protein n=1 Tax=Pisum sativum TaxID=3888 RepID=A0A9D5BH53_PEA|nr:hypothetical protein KIW84_012289 [Pisum sativum]
MFRSKKFPTFRSMQLVAFRSVFRCSDRRSFRRSGRRNLWHSGQPLGVQTDINNLISPDVQIEVISSIQTDERHSGHEEISGFLAPLTAIASDLYPCGCDTNPLPAHGNSSVNMVDGCPGEFKVFDVRFIKRSLVMMHKDICLVSDYEHDHDGCAICNVNPIVVKTPERVVIQYERNNNNSINKRSVSLLVIRLVGLVPYTSDKVVPYQYNATMLKYGQEVPLPTTSSVVSIVDVTKVTRSGQVFGPVFPKDVEDCLVGKKVGVPAVDLVSAPKRQSGESSNLKTNDDDGVLWLIKKKAHREAPQRVLEQAFMEHDVTVDQFDHIVANITSCNNLSFCDEELPEEGRNHNLALHISMNCKDDALSNVLVNTGSSLNMLPKSTLSKLSYQGAPMRYSGVIVKAFDGSRKMVMGEVDLPLGRPWIHEAGAVTSTLHQKLKFVKNGKLVIVCGEKALLVSHLSSFSYVEAEDEVGTPFQALSIAVEKRVGAPMSSLKDARKIVEEGIVDQWGRVVEVSNKKNRTGLGFQQGLSAARSEDMQLSFHSGGFIHSN